MAAVIKQNEEVAEIAKSQYANDLALVAIFNSLGLEGEDQQRYMEAKALTAPNATDEAFARAMMMNRINLSLEMK